MSKKQKLELTWIGKENRPKLEPRILLEDPAKSYHAKFRVKGGYPQITQIHADLKTNSNADAGIGSGVNLRESAKSADKAFDVDPVGDIFDNKLIFGDNLLALKALEAEFAGKVKCVFIDPPYNTGSAFTHYDDGVEHSIWLSLMRDRLEIIRRLLSEDGSLWITIDDNEAHYLKVLCDEVFGRPNFVATMIWEKRTTRENRRVFSFNHDFVLVYGKDKPLFEAHRNPLPLSDEVLSRYKNPDNDPRGPWQSISANAQAGHATASQFYTLVVPNGKEHEPPKGTCWRYTKEKMQREIALGNIWLGKEGNGVPRIKKFLDKSEDSGLTPETIWKADAVGTNDEAKKGIMELLPDHPVFDNPKPERLIQRIVHIATNPGDLVLDSFAGSGTTGAVAHKMGRRWIMIELGEHCHTHIIPRLQKVIDGEDKGGISEAANWQGGGGFRYYKLAPSLLRQDAHNQWVINKEYNAEMLAQALCKLEGFTYAPSDAHYWMHGHSTERDFIYVTTANLNHEQLQALNDEVAGYSSTPSLTPESPHPNPLPEGEGMRNGGRGEQDGGTLLVLCTAFRGKGEYPNLTVKKIPKQVLSRCEWGHDDYSLQVENLPKAPPSPPAPLPQAGEGRKTKLANAAQGGLFEEGEA